ncbi:MAG: hypothetical protein GX141_10095 [Armatimonadetes bacterium]|nr:hypothetical protein [Armatimonadota bacterium]
MNALPVGPDGVGDDQSRDRYFADLERFGFDIAYNAYYAGLYSDVVGRQQTAYREFAAEAHKRGYPACIQIQITVCAGDRVGIDQAQRNIENQPERNANDWFFASFSSKQWLAYLKELTTIFIQEYNYDWIVFEEPMYRVDIPGTQDPFYADFTTAHPNIAYPTKRRETTEYLTVQQAKADALFNFCQELVSHAKSVGAKKAGVMPWFFIPTIENTPPETLNPSCQIQRIAAMPELDFIVVRMQPDNIHCETMRTGDELTNSARLYYSEILAHSLGKPVIAVNNPTDEHTIPEPGRLIPLEFFTDYTLAGVAASPCGFTRHWYGKNYDSDHQHMQVLADAASFAGRLGQPGAPIAYVFSYTGTQHAEPFNYETVFPFYWDLVSRLQFEYNTPVLTFFADTLEEDLARHPEVQLLILEEHFPLTHSQMSVISRWWRGEEMRGLVAFGSGLGYCADRAYPGARPSSAACPGVFELIGLKQDADPQYVNHEPLTLRDVSRIRRGAFLGDRMQLKTDRIANVRRIFGSRASILYEVDTPDGPIPAVAEWRDRATLALFCGFGLSESTVEAACMAVKYAMREVGCRSLLVETDSSNIVWSANKHNYITISNLSTNAEEVRINSGRAFVWDCRQQKMVSESDVEVSIQPKSFNVYRLVGRRSKFIDIHGASCVNSIIDGAGRADIDILAGRQTVLIVKASPKEIIVDGKHSTVTQEVNDGMFYVNVNQCAPGDHKITLKW